MTFTGVVAQSFQRQWTLCDKAVASAWRARRTLVTARMLLVAEGPDRIGALLVHGRAIHARLCRLFCRLFGPYYSRIEGP